MMIEKDETEPKKSTQDIAFSSSNHITVIKFDFLQHGLNFVMFYNYVIVSYLFT